MTLLERYEDTVNRRGSVLWQRAVGAVWEIASYWASNEAASPAKRAWMVDALKFENAVGVVDACWGLCLNNVDFKPVGQDATDATVKSIMETVMGQIYGSGW